MQPWLSNHRIGLQIKSGARRGRKFRKPRTDLYQSVTDTIIAQLEQGAVPWVQP